MNTGGDFNTPAYFISRMCSDGARLPLVLRTSSVRRSANVPLGVGKHVLAASESKIFCGPVVADLLPAVRPITWEPQPTPESAMKVRVASDRSRRGTVTPHYSAAG